MKKLLYLARLFPPAQFVACIRTWNTAKQLSRLGWRVTVVTPHPKMWRRVSDRDNFAQAITEIGLEIVHTGHHWPWLDSENLHSCFPRLAWLVGGVGRRILRKVGIEAEVGWGHAVKKACAKYEPGAYDAILATGSPFMAFPLAEHFGRRLRCPIVLDYRDLWTTGNPHRDRLYPPWIRRMEMRAYMSASAVTVVSSAWRQMLIDALGCPERVHVLSNGFDMDELAKVQPQAFKEPAVIYAGGFYPPKRVLDPVMEALRPLTIPNLRWKFHYYGPSTAAAQEAAVKAGISERLVVHGSVPRSEVLSAAKGAHCAIVITNVQESELPADRGIVTGKVFELVGLGVPVLLVAPRESDAEQAIHSCGKRFSGQQLQEMTHFLGDLLTRPSQKCQASRELEWKHLGIKLNEILQASVAT